MAVGVKIRMSNYESSIWQVGIFDQDLFIPFAFCH